MDWDPSNKIDNPQVEWDIFGGKHFDLGDGTDFNAEAYYYAYPAADYPGFTASYFEGIFQLSHTFAGLAVTGTWAISPEFSFGTGLGNYISGSFSYPIMDWLSVSANVGHQWVNDLPDYTHGDIGATVTYKSLSVDARYVTTDLGKTNCGFYMGTNNACAGGFVATVTYNMALLP